MEAPLAHQVISSLGREDVAIGSISHHVGLRILASESHCPRLSLCGETNPIGAGWSMELAPVLGNAGTFVSKTPASPRNEDDSSDSTPRAPVSVTLFRQTTDLLALARHLS